MKISENSRWEIIMNFRTLKSGWGTESNNKGMKIESRWAFSKMSWRTKGKRRKSNSETWKEEKWIWRNKAAKAWRRFEKVMKKAGGHFKSLRWRRAKEESSWCKNQETWWASERKDFIERDGKKN